MAGWYTGVGSRKTPPDVLEVMTAIARVCRDIGLTLRSGGAEGADLAFEKGADGRCEIYLPWPGFNGSRSELSAITTEGIELARQAHPHFDKLAPAVQRLMTRNVYQVLGYDLSKKSKFVVCWTPDGATNLRERTPQTGGTGQAIAIACLSGVPVFNLARPGDVDIVLDLLRSESKT